MDLVQSATMMSGGVAEGRHKEAEVTVTRDLTSNGGDPELELCSDSTIAYYRRMRTSHLPTHI